MLKKLLKYDIKYVLKYWWIAAVVCLSLSVAGGFAQRLLQYSLDDRELPSVVTSSASSILFFSYVSYIVIAIICVVLVFTRFHNNFFSDEGYLTFTLPVKRTTLINSKLITATLSQIATIILIALCVVIMAVIAHWETFWTLNFWKEIVEFLKDYFGDNTLCRIIYILEFLIGSILCVISANLFLFCCITLASIITKKARVITSIGIYYGINCLISFAFQIFAIFGIEAIGSYFNNISHRYLEPVICVAVVGIILLISIFCSVLYTIQYYMLDRKLNLA